MSKKAVMFLTFFLTTFTIFSQDKEIQVYYGISSSEFMRSTDLDGAPSHELENPTEFGLRYLRRMKGNLFLETGITYASANITITPAFTGTPVSPRKEELELLTVPVFVNYTLWNHLFINGGPLLGFDLSENTTDPQKGLGFGLGIGGKFNYRDFTFFANPNFKKHAVIPFQKELYHQKLTQFGVQVGVGYTF